MNQHTGNWAGKTVELSFGTCTHMGNKLRIVDLPGTYSLRSDSPEEKITDDHIIDGSFDCVIIVADATSLERNLMLTLQILSKTNKAVLCLNLADEAKKKGISIDTDELSLRLGIPVVETSARYKKGIDKLMDAVVGVASGEIKTFSTHEIAALCDDSKRHEEETEKISALSRNIAALTVGKRGEVYSQKDRLLDEIFTSKLTGIPIMILVFAIMFWLTAFVANVPGEWLTSLFAFIKEQLINLCEYLKVNETIRSFLIDGVYTTASWVVSVMLPPAAIFFPLFAILEDSGYLPRVAFNLDRCFQKVGVSGKQALTMLMGFGCNACGVMGCRIIPSKKERITAILTNTFIPCNGRIPTLISLISIFFASTLSGLERSFATTGILILLLLLSVAITLAVSFLLTKVQPRERNTGFVLELPPYRKPQFIKTILLSFKEKVFYVLSRAVLVSVPAGGAIWLLSNSQISGSTILSYITDFLGPVGLAIGVDGVILTAYFLAFPANEIFIPIMLMAYTSNSMLIEYSSLEQLGELLTAHGWTMLTAVCTAVLCLLHFPCSTTCFAIKRETKSNLWTAISVLMPIVVGMGLCLVISVVTRLFI